MRESSTKSEIRAVISETMISVTRNSAAIAAISAIVSFGMYCLAIGRSWGWKIQATTAAPPKGRTPFKPQLVEGAGDAPVMPIANDTRELPILGRIAAGTPIEAIQQERDRIPVPETILGAGEHFVLEIAGDSMINAGILDGDYVVIRKTDTANSGDIVVALVMGEEATLKRLRKKGASIALEASNPAYETRIFGPDQVQVQGRLVGLIRRYH